MKKIFQIPVTGRWLGIAIYIDRKGKFWASDQYGARQITRAKADLLMGKTQQNHKQGRERKWHGKK